jgi:S-DNA-T family DNA segregation ATPase FtsK/SpoIIIE
MAFRVSAKVDSRTILDTGGADQLVGRGDMLILNGNDLVRVQCAFVDTPEVERVVEFIGQQQGYPSAFDLPEYEGSDGMEIQGISSVKSLKDVDQMFEQCARLVVSSGSGSTSMLQRRFNLGYNRAGRIMDQLESVGIVGASTGGKPRELMVHSEMELEEILNTILNRN